MTGKGKNNNKGNYNDKNKCEGSSPLLHRFIQDQGDILWGADVVVKR
jgi:hypothetical protein